MKKMITMILAAALLTGCNSAATQPMQPQNDFTMCGVTVTGDQADNQWHSGTPLTDIAEKLLKERYDEDFTAEQMVYYDEYSLCIRFQAHPVSDPDLVFRYGLTGQETPELSYDEYYTILHKGDVSALFAPTLSVIGLTEEDIDITCHLEKGTAATEAILRNGENHVYLNFPDEESAKAARDKRQEFCQRVLDCLHPRDTYFHTQVNGKTVPYDFSLCSGSEGELFFVNCWLDDKKFDKIPLNDIPAIICSERTYIEDVQTIVKFVDREGNFYSIDDEEFCHASNAKLIAALIDGELEKFRTGRTCDQETLMQQYYTLQEAANYGETALNEPTELPDVEDPKSAQASGYCVDSNGEFHTVTMYKYTCMTRIYSTNEKINELYKWFNKKE